MPSSRRCFHSTPFNILLLFPASLSVSSYMSYRPFLLRLPARTLQPRAFSTQLQSHNPTAAPSAPPSQPEAAAAAVRWWHVDATGKVAGRLASHLAHILQGMSPFPFLRLNPKPVFENNRFVGKHKPTYDRAKLNGDIVVVSNVEKILFTGKKMTDKECASTSSRSNKL
jgi:hypothetical protein